MPSPLNETPGQKNVIVPNEPVRNEDIAKETKTAEQPTSKDLIPETKIIANDPSPEYLALATSYKADVKNDNYVFYNVTQDEFKKTKLFGFLKKVKRVIERKSPFHNDKAEVAVN